MTSAPWAKFSLPGDAPAFAFGASPEFTRTIRETFGPLVERISEVPVGPIAWILAEVPAEGSLTGFFRTLEKRLARAGSLWTVLPKKPFAAELKFPYTWLDVQKAGLSAGLVDNKIAAFSPRLTSIRFVVPIARRKSKPGG
ncbi:MAG: hypothetical protein LC796_03750 [Acidobacteria bacterium]|nr:hypothetical protein [Acidobacteriota bacterium]MCA1612491.1 hypothetical protein [Acidobacteriota bacterium]